MSVFLSIVVWILLGWMTSYLAQQRGRDPSLWFILGIVLGLFAVLLLFILPPVVPENEKQEKPSYDDDEVLQPNPEIIEVQPQSVQSEVELFPWYYLDQERQQKGPIEFSELKKHWTENKIDPLTYVWREGMPEWKKIEELPDLRNSLI